MATPQLFLHEELMLLALRDEEGTIEPGAMLTHAIAGAALAELMLHERINVEESRWTKSKLANPVSLEPIGEPLLDECLALIGKAGRRAAIQSWVSRIAAMKDLCKCVAWQLCARGILRADKEKVLFIFNREVYPELDPEPERELRERLHEAIFTNALDIDPRTVILISLAHRTGLLKAVFDRKALKRQAKRIDQIVNGELTGKAAAEAVQAAQAAQFVTLFIMPMMMTSMMSSNH